MTESAQKSSSGPPSGGQRSPELVCLGREAAMGQGLEAFDPWPAAMQVRPVGRHAIKVWYTGRYLTSMIYQVDEGILRFTDLPYDEHVCVLSGGAVLTSGDGKRHQFTAGDVFVVPKGWSGTWEFLPGYRELVTFETQSVEAAMREWFPTLGAAGEEKP